MRSPLLELEALEQKHTILSKTLNICTTQEELMDCALLACRLGMP